MNMDHVQPYLEAMDARDVPSLAEHLSEDVVLESPIVGTPFVGKEAVLKVLAVLLSGVDEFETTAVIAGEQRAAVMLRIRAGEAEVTGALSR